MPTADRSDCNGSMSFGDSSRVGMRLLTMLLMTAAWVLPVSAGTVRGKSASGAGAVENRCGWFVNPTPANAWLIDRDGEWIIATQGGEQAEGDWPSPISETQWVSYGNGSYGHGCACMRVVTDRATMHVKRIVSSAGKPLAQCRRDRKLVEPRD